MNNAFYIVVGDIFKSPLSTVEDILSESEAIELIVHSDALTQDVVFSIQQGVNVMMLERAVEHQARRVPSTQGKITLQYDRDLPRAVRRLAHKARAENICVSYPRRVSEQEFEVDLHFSNQNELFLDHMTGMHIQGMALTEAARQAFLAITEEFFLKESKEKWYFVIHHQNATFKQFVFPLAVRLSYRINSHSAKEGRHSFAVEMEVHQAGVSCCHFDVSFTTFEAERISRREEQLMRERIAEMRAKWEQQASFDKVLLDLTAGANDAQQQQAALA